MFETVIPPASQRNRLVFYESLPISVAIHTLVVAAVALAIVNRLDFPLQPPRVSTAYVMADLTPPPPPPPPPPPAASSAATTLTTTQPVNVARVEDLAPTIIPDRVVELPPPQPQPLLASLTPNVQPASLAAPGGVAGGVPGGVVGGVVGGDRNGVIGGLGGTIGNDGRLHVKKDAPLPMAIEARPYPDYPDQERTLAHEGDVVIRYIVGKDGHVAEARVTKTTNRKNFEKSAVEAIRRWRFRPLIVDGEPIEVVHEVTVYFKLF